MEMYEPSQITELFSDWSQSKNSISWTNKNVRKKFIQNFQKLNWEFRLAEGPTCLFYSALAYLHFWHRGLNEFILKPLKIGIYIYF